MAYPCCDVTKTLLMRLKINPRWRTVRLFRLLDCVSCVLFCSSHAMTSSVIYYSTDARKNEIYLLNKPPSTNPLTKGRRSKRCIIFIQFPAVKDPMYNC